METPVYLNMSAGKKVKVYFNQLPTKAVLSVVAHWILRCLVSDKMTIG